MHAQETTVVDGSSVFGDLTARQIGPALMSGRVNDLEIHPTNNKIVYLGAGGGGVWKSNDGGATFIPICLKSSGLSYKAKLGLKFQK